MLDEKIIPKYFSIYDFNPWCINQSYDENSLQSTLVPYYYINDINDIFILYNIHFLLFLHGALCNHIAFPYFIHK